MVFSNDFFGLSFRFRLFRCVINIVSIINHGIIDLLWDYYKLCFVIEI